VIAGNRKSLAWIVGGAALLALPALIDSPYYMHMLVMSALFVIISAGLNLVFGYAGQLALGYTAFFAVGAYTAALLALNASTPFLVNILLAGAACGLLAYLLGYPCLRLRGPHFAILTIAFAEIIRLVANNWISLTRGPMGLSGIPSPVLDVPGVAVVKLGGESGFYYIALALAVVTVYATYRIANSPAGRAFVGIRENQDLAAAVGIDLFRFKMQAWVASGIIAGVGGGAYAYYIQVVDPLLFSFYYTFVVFTMVVVGGRGTVFGPVVGGVLFTLLPESLRLAESYRMLIFALILLGCMLFFPKGIVGWFARRQAEARAELGIRHAGP